VTDLSKPFILLFKAPNPGNPKLLVTYDAASMIVFSFQELREDI
jgi:hypothetical protein